MFRVARPSASLALVAMLVAGGAAPALAQDKMSAEQIKRAVSGKTGSWVTADRKYSGTTNYAPNGSLTGKVDTGGSTEEFDGRWGLQGDQLCEQISIDPEGSRCHTMVRASGNSYRLIDKDGKVASTVTVR